MTWYNMTVKELFPKKGNVCFARYLLLTSLFPVNKHTAEFSHAGVIQEWTGSTSLYLWVPSLTHRSSPPPALQPKYLLHFLKNQQNNTRTKKFTQYISLKNEAPWRIYNEASCARMVFHDSATIDDFTEAKRETVREGNEKWSND